MGSTEIINHTTKALKVKLGNNRVYTEIATVEKDAVYKVSVDSNATYHEFCMGVDAAGKLIIVNSDECVDNQEITITEMDGKFNLVKVPRQIQRQVDQTRHVYSSKRTPAAPSISTATKSRQPSRSTTTSWTFWKAPQKHQTPSNLY
ncbi:unnamed protein product [Sphagnum compactum]